jgi:predicted nucleic acid-binding protein
MLVIADTSPIISLLLIEKFEVLERLFPGFLIPQAVWEELDSHQEIRMYQDELHRLSRQVREITCHFRYYSKTYLNLFLRKSGEPAL